MNQDNTALGCHTREGHVPEQPLRQQRGSALRPERHGLDLRLGTGKVLSLTECGQVRRWMVK